MFSKLKEIKYLEFKTQPYLVDQTLNKKEMKLLLLLRSRCYSAKNNFKNMHKQDFKCSFKCDTSETQEHIFENCQPLKQLLKDTISCKVSSVFGSFEEQKTGIKSLVEIDKMRNDSFPPGGRPGPSRNIFSV